MINLFHYLYVISYLYSIKVNGREDWFNNFQACLMLVVTFFFNIYSIAMLIDLFIDLNLLHYINSRVSRDNIIYIAGGICLFVFAYFFIGQRYERILVDFDLDKKLALPKYYHPGATFLIGTILSFFIMGFLTINKGDGG